MLKVGAGATDHDAVKLAYWRPRTIRARLFTLGVGGLVTMTALQIAIGITMSAGLQTKALELVDQLILEDQEHVATGLAQLTAVAGRASVERVELAQRVALAEVRGRGGVRRTGDEVTWQAVNQFTQRVRQVTLPGLAVGDASLGRNLDPMMPSPVVDGIRARVGARVTIFQRMNAAGDLLRVSTNVTTRVGARAVGSYIPAIGPDGQPNPVASAIKAGRPYRGAAQVIGTWYVTAYDPVKDDRGRVVGAISLAVAQSEADAGLIDTVAKFQVGENGTALVLSTGEADEGRVVAANDRNLVGRRLLADTDADGVPYIQQALAAAGRLRPGQVWHGTFRLPGLNGDPPAPSRVTVLGDPSYQRAVVVQGYAPDYAGPSLVYRDGRRVVAVSLLSTSAILMIVFAVLFWRHTGRISRRLVATTQNLARITRRDLTGRVDDVGDDEIGRMNAALGAAVTELREMVAAIGRTADEVGTAAGQVGSVGRELYEASATATRRAATMGDSAADVSAGIATVVHSSEGIAASIGQISRNAEDAASVAGDGATLARRASSVVDTLGRSNEQISQVVKAISDIAEQTNLLALNATIEAARAGESGRGFAVVAAEVKDLARQTADATEDVTGRVASIQAASKDAVQAITAIRQVIDKVSTYSTAIAAAVEVQSVTTHEMADSVGRVAGGSSEIVSGMNQLTETVTTTRRAVTSARHAAASLQSNAELLNELVRRFRV